MTENHQIVAIVPCNNLDASEAFYRKLGFVREPGKKVYEDYRMLANDKGCCLHLTQAVDNWLVPSRNPFGLYIYTPEVDTLAAVFGSDIVEKNGPEHKPWGMYEFAVPDPDQTLVRVGWPSKGKA